MFTKTLIFIFCFIGIFAVLFAGINSEFYTYTFTSSVGSAKDYEEEFDLADVTIYGQVGEGNMSYAWSSYHDHPSAPQHQAGLPSGQYLEVWWGQSGFLKILQFRHTTEQWWGLAFHPMDIYTQTGFGVGTFILVTDLESEWDDNANASVFQTKTPVSSSYLIQYNQTKYATITDAWNGNEINYVLSYELDQNATAMSIWGVLGTILTFNAPALGLTGVGGTILNACIAFPFYAITAVLIAKIIFAIIPFIRGIEE